MKAVEQVVLEAAKRCRASAGSDWDAFLQALKSYADRRLDGCLSVPADELIGFRGEARATRLLYELLAQAK